MSCPESAVMPSSTPAVPGLGEALTDHFLPFQRRISVCDEAKAPFSVRPTAQTLFAERATTSVSRASAPAVCGVVISFHAEPFQWRIQPRCDPSRRDAVPTAQTSDLEIPATPSSRAGASRSTAGVSENAAPQPAVVVPGRRSAAAEGGEPGTSTIDVTARMTTNDP